MSGTGKPLRQFIYSRDLAKLMVWQLRFYDQIDPLILSVSEAEEVTIKHVADEIVRAVGFEGHYSFDSTKADGQCVWRCERMVADDPQVQEDGLEREADEAAARVQVHAVPASARRERGVVRAKLRLGASRFLASPDSSRRGQAGTSSTERSLAPRSRCTYCGPGHFETSRSRGYISAEQNGAQRLAAGSCPVSDAIERVLAPEQPTCKGALRLARFAEQGSARLIDERWRGDDGGRREIDADRARWRRGSCRGPADAVLVADGIFLRSCVASARQLATKTRRRCRSHRAPCTGAGAGPGRCCRGPDRPCSASRRTCSTSAAPSARSAAERRTIGVLAPRTQVVGSSQSFGT